MKINLLIITVALAIIISVLILFTGCYSNTLKGTYDTGEVFYIGNTRVEVMEGPVEIEIIGEE